MRAIYAAPRAAPLCYIKVVCFLVPTPTDWLHVCLLSSLPHSASPLPGFRPHGITHLNAAFKLPLPAPDTQQIAKHKVGAALQPLLVHGKHVLLVREPAGVLLSWAKVSQVRGARGAAICKGGRAVLIALVLGHGLAGVCRLCCL